MTTITKKTAFAVLDGKVCMCCFAKLTKDNTPLISNADLQMEYDAHPCDKCWTKIQENRDIKNPEFDKKCDDIWKAVMEYEDIYRRARDLCDGCGEVCFDLEEDEGGYMLCEECIEEQDDY
jgi:hypothetical protein